MQDFYSAEDVAIGGHCRVKERGLRDGVSWRTDCVYEL